MSPDWPSCHLEERRVHLRRLPRKCRIRENAKIWQHLTIRSCCRAEGSYARLITRVCRPNRIAVEVCVTLFADVRTMTSFGMLRDIEHTGHETDRGRPKNPQRSTISSHVNSWKFPPSSRWQRCRVLVFEFRWRCSRRMRLLPPQLVLQICHNACAASAIILAQLCEGNHRRLRTDCRTSSRFSSISKSLRTRRSLLGRRRSGGEGGYNSVSVRAVSRRDDWVAL